MGLFEFLYYLLPLFWLMSIAYVALIRVDSHSMCSISLWTWAFFFGGGGVCTFNGLFHSLCCCCGSRMYGKPWGREKNDIAFPPWLKAEGNFSHHSPGFSYFLSFHPWIVCWPQCFMQWFHCIRKRRNAILSQTALMLLLRKLPWVCLSQCLKWSLWTHKYIVCHEGCFLSA